MKAKKLVAFLLAVVMLFSLSENAALAASPEEGYYYGQLDALAQTVYDGIGQIDLATGTDEYDLAADLTAIPSQSELNRAMNAARYAYYADHPEIFYVDFPKLSLRTTQDAAGKKHIYIGSGRNASYLISAFADKAAVGTAVNEFNNRVAEIAAGARAVTDESGKSLQAAQIEYVHNEIIHNVSYRLEDTADSTNTSLLGTPYGVLVRKQGVCEGYSRAFKAVMDELGINCILVQGVHQYDGEAAVDHMWNYVEITDGASRTGGSWYAVDATLDDPEVPVAIPAAEYNKYHQGFASYGDDGFEQDKYLLAGQLAMNEKHFEAEEVNAAGGYRFSYPVLEDNNFHVTSVSNDLDGFKVIVEDVTDPISHNTLTEYQFNYLGMTATQAKEKGIYLLFRYYEEDEATGEIVPVYSDYGSWFYLDPDAYSMSEENGFVHIQEGKQPYVEIAATTVAPEEDPPADKLGAELTYQGDDSGLIARTGKLYNPNRTDYVAPPFVLKQTPSQTSTITISDRFYHITAEFDETLVQAQDADTVAPRIQCRDRYGAAVTGSEYSEIRNFTWDNDRTVSFDMKFSMMYADSNIAYNIYIDGLVGETSQKAPNPIVYTVRRKTSCPCIMVRDGNWDVFGKPALLEGDDLSINGWKTANGLPLDNILSNRLALVTTRTTEVQNQQIDRLVNENVSENILQSETYNIGLSLCKTMIVKTGDKVKVRLGFPAGYGPDDEGVTFKAYHFKRDSQGNVTGVEEIGCVVTQYGLIITCDAFSPFMIAAVEKDETVVEDKTVVVTASDGGTVSGVGLDASGIVTLSENGSQTVTYTAREGYQIESVTVCGKEIRLTNKATATVTVSYNDVRNANNIVNANFVAKEVVQNEIAKNESVVKPVAEAAKITMPSSKTVAAGDTLRIEPTVSAQDDSVQSFQWYKDGVKLEGKINKNLEIANVTENAAGKYTLTVTTTVDTVSAESKSRECVVAVTPKADDFVSPFTDVPKAAYYAAAVSWAVENRVTAGTSETTFGPDESCTRAQAVAFLWRAADRPEPKSIRTGFTDVEAGSYYEKAVAWAVENRITAGTSETTFGPEETCTRAQIVAFLWRAADRAEPTSTSTNFTDVEAGAYYEKAVAWAAENRITAGTSDTTFGPEEDCVRCQIVSFLYRSVR